MKKIYYLASFATALFFVTSCAKEIDNNTDEKPIVIGEKIVSLSGNVGPETKVSTDNVGAFKWQDSDKITILTDNGNNREFTAASAGLTSDFSGHIPEADNLDGGLALYPASDDHFTDGSDYLFNLSSTITWSADASMMPMISKISIVESKPQATFKAVGGVMKLVCYNIPAGATELWFTADGKNIVGSFEVDPDAAEPAITSDAGSNDTVIIDFADNYSANKVFYIPLPVVNLNGFTITITDGSKELFSITTDANPSIVRNKMLIAPALNCGMVFNDEVSNSVLTAALSGSYSDVSFKGTKGKDWSANACKQSDKMQIRSSSGSHIHLPSYDDNISSIILHGVYAAGTDAYSGTISFTTAITDGTTIASVTPSSISAGDDVTISVSGSYKTGYILTSAGLRVTSMTVKFKSAAYSGPSITLDPETINIAVADGSTNSSSASIAYSAISGDNMGISIVSHSSWITPELTGSGSSYTLSVSAAKYSESANDRTPGSVVLRATGVTKTITVTQPSALVPNPVLTVIPGNGSFTATWTKHANAVGYVIYLGDPENGGTNISDDAGLSYDSGTNEYTLTKSVVNDDYDLYVSATPVVNYIGEDGYSHESFTCSATSYTVTITQPASGGTFTASGNSVSFTASQGDVIALVATPSSSSYKFVSWTVTGATPASTTNASTTFTMPAANVTVTASFAAKEWVKVTDASTLAAGQQIMLVATVSGSKTDANNGTFAANGTISSDVMGKVSATITSNKLTSYTGAQSFTLGKSDSYWTLSNGSVLLGVTQVKKLAWGDGTTTWTISITEGVATIENTSSGYGKIKYNRDSPRFTTYTGDFSASMAGPMIFRYE